jgi:hypothetical protein
MLFPFISLFAQNWDLRLNTRSQITTPADGTPSQLCSSASSNLTFQVANDSPTNLVLATVSMTATLTLVGNTFSPSSSNVATNVFITTSAGSPTPGEIRAGNFASFNWPTPLNFAGTGITTVTIEIVADSGTDPILANNSQEYVLTVLANPTQPTLTSNYGNGTISICQGASVLLTSSAVGNQYEFYRDGVLLGPRASNSTFTTTDLNHNDVVTVIAYFASNCSSVGVGPLNVEVESIPQGTLESDADNNVACEGDTVLFTSADSNSNPTPFFEFFVNNASTGAASTVKTYSHTVITDNVVVKVRTWSSSPSLCYDEDSITLRVNSVSNSNIISGSQTICSGDNTATIINNSTFI